MKILVSANADPANVLPAGYDVPLSARDNAVPLQAVLTTAELDRRTSRAADYETENRVLVALMQEMTRSSANMLQRLVENALSACRAHSAGISILEQKDDGEPAFVWRALAGQWSRFLGGTMPRDSSPCGTVLDRDAPLLMSYPQRHFPFPPDLDPPVVEVLLIPFHVAGKAAGTLWVVSHDESCRFDAEDKRLLMNLGNFASAAHQIRSAQERETRAAADAMEELAATRRLQDISTRLISQGDVDALYRQLLDAAIDLMHSDMASMQMLYPERGELRLIASKGFMPTSSSHWEWVGKGCGSSCGEALRAGRRAVVTDVEACEFIRGRDLEEYRASGIRAVQSTPLVSRSGQPLGMISTHWRRPHRPSEHDLRLFDVLARQAADLIERAQTEARLRDSEERFRIMADSSPIVIWVTNSRGEIEFVNRAYLQFFGICEAQIRGQNGWQPLVHPDDATAYIAEFLAALRDRKAFVAEARVRHADGDWRWIASHGVPRFSPSGEFLGHVGSSSDVTQRKRSAQALAESARQKDALYQLADRLHRTASLDDVYAAAVEAIVTALQCERASILLLDEGGVMRFVGWRGLSDAYRKAVEGHSPWAPDAENPQPICVGHVETADLSDSLRAVVRAEGIGALAFIPLVSNGKLIGKFMAYFDSPHVFTDDQLELGRTIAHQLAFGINRQRAEEALKETDQRKDVFLATLAHELRNPLAPLLNGLQIVKLNRNDAEAVERWSSMMERQLGHMVRLIDDLLDMSRISRGKIELRKERVDLAKVIEQAVETNRPLIDASRQDLTVQMPGHPIVVDADFARLAQVVGNLVNNACKFTQDSGHIWLSLAREGEQAVIRVQDTGVGIAADQVAHIFEMFTQLDASLERRQSGLGIGLTLVKTLTEMHGGIVEAHSAGMGLGSEFVVRLPIRVDTGDEVRTATAASSLPCTTALRVLVVDDNQDAATSLASLLQLAGHETQVAHDGVEAMQAAASTKPDLILLDIGLPKLNGYEVARRIREQPWGRDIVLVALTGWGQDNDRKKSKNVGFDSHLVKPVDHSGLMSLLAEFGGRRATTSQTSPSPSNVELRT